MEKKHLAPRNYLRFAPGFNRGSLLYMIKNGQKRHKKKTNDCHTVRILKTATQVATLEQMWGQGMVGWGTQCENPATELSLLFDT